MNEFRFELSILIHLYQNFQAKPIISYCLLDLVQAKKAFGETEATFCD